MSPYICNAFLSNLVYKWRPCKQGLRYDLPPTGKTMNVFNASTKKLSNRLIKTLLSGFQIVLLSLCIFNHY